MEQIGPTKKTLQPNPELQPLLIPEPEAPSVPPIAPDTLKENQDFVREERAEEAEKPPYTDI